VQFGVWIVSPLCLEGVHVPPDIVPCCGLELSLVTQERQSTLICCIFLLYVPQEAEWWSITCMEVPKVAFDHKLVIRDSFLRASDLPAARH
jgi:hypothetical protein